MGHLPISSHIAVVSPSGVKKPPETNANALPAGDSGGKFADVLASQIAPQDVKTLAQDVPTVAAQATDTSALVENAQVAAELSAQPLPDAFSALSLPNLSLAQVLEQATEVGDKSKVKALAVETSTKGSAASLVSSATTSLLAEIKPDAVRTAAAKKAADTAILAVSDKALPLKEAVAFEALELKQSALVSAHLPVASRLEPSVSSAPAPAPVSLPVDVKVGAQGWDAAFSQRVAWAATNQHQVAELRLNPPNLGPVEVRITITNDQATASFVSSHASVRESIEAALPKLREMLAESGLTLGNVNVSSQSFQQQQQQQAEQGGNKSNTPHGRVLPDPAQDIPQSLPNVASLVVGKNGLVDVFA